MHFKTIALFLSAANALPPNDGRHDLPDSAAVIEALNNPDVYEQLSRHHRSTLQTPFDAKNVFLEENRRSRGTCGARPACPAFEGERRRINGRSYNLYCHNAPWGSYFWLPKSKSLEECEQHCHSNEYECNGLTFYPSTGACSIIHSRDSAPYIWDNGYQKIGAIPADSNISLGPGELCPLPGSDNQVWELSKGKYEFKLSCHNQFNVQPQNRKQVGPVRDVEECAERCSREDSCNAFHYYQPTYPGGRTDGQRNCELITENIKDGDWVPIHKPNQYLAGLMVDSFNCGDVGWNRDEKGDRERERNEERRRRHRNDRNRRNGDRNDRDEDEEDDDDDIDEERRSRRHRHHNRNGRSDYELDSDDDDEQCHRRRRDGRCDDNDHNRRNGRNGRNGRDQDRDDDDENDDDDDVDEESQNRRRRRRHRNDRNRNRSRNGRYEELDLEDYNEDNDDVDEESRNRRRRHRNDRNRKDRNHNGRYEAMDNDENDENCRHRDRNGRCEDREGRHGRNDRDDRNDR
ncbi:hypothetical protein K432DRAFT_386018, partial [Lepidopterella palustris CBS 459.81]